MPYSLIVVLPFLIALALAAIRPRASVAGGAASLTMAAMFATALSQLSVVAESGPFVLSIPWMPQIGLTLSVYADGLALLFVLLITGIGAAVMFYAGSYFDDDRKASRFLALLLAFSASMLALVLAGNVLTMFIAWELTSITSFLLIGFNGHDAAARRGASQALIVTAGGGLALVAGLLILGSAVSTFELAEIVASGDMLRDHPWYNAILILILVGAFSKSAQFPLHFWLPGAMSAPTPASAFLHSATMVKAGIYLLARLAPALGDTPLWTTALPLFGLATLVVGAVLALGQRDLKAILAYSTISQLGALVALIGLPHNAGLKAAYVGILAHGLYKCALFLVAGAVDHAAGTRDITRLGGLRRRMPGYAAVTAIAGLSMAGVPPLFGFVAKELLIESAEHNTTLALVVTVLSAALTVAVALWLFWDVFMRPAPAHHDIHFHALPRPLIVGPAALAAASLAAGLGVGALVSPLVGLTIGEPTDLYLFPPDGLHLTFWLSMLALGLGTAVFLLRRWWMTWAVPLPSGTRIYHGVLHMIERIADLLLRSQNGHIRLYITVILSTVIVLLTTAILRILPFEAEPVNLFDATDILKAVLLLLALTATGASILFRRHILAVLSLGIAGYSIGGILLLEPAPDVALVQFLVETLATVLILLILARTSPQERQRAISDLWGQSRTGLARDALIAVALGSAMAIFALAAVSSRPTPNTIAVWHLENALPQVGVYDVVAGIVTDFRGMDTMIEITVFAMASLGVLTVLTRPTPGRTIRIIGLRRPPPAAEASQTADQPDQDMRPPDYTGRFVDPVTQLAALLVLPFSFVIAAAHIAYAGVAPGDGFTAGVIIGLGVALWFVVFGYQETKARLRWLRPAPLIGVGLTIALANAAVPLLFGREFFAFTFFEGLSISDIKLASTVLFEIGICLTVFGGISSIMESISHPKEAEPL